MAKKKKKRKIPLRKLIRRWEIKADRALSLYVRAATAAEYGGKCPLCGVRPIQCCFHIVTRRRKIIRWDVRNVVGACHTCNYLERKYSDPSRAWYIRRHGVDAYLALVDESAHTLAFTVEELQALVAKFAVMLGQVKAVTLLATPDAPPEHPLA